MKAIRGLLVAAVLLDVAYWTLWFSKRDWLASRDVRAYYDFENAFPLADLWLGVCCLLALLTLGRRSSALFWLLAAGSAGMYLGCMDLLYDLQHDIFLASGSGGYVELAIVLLTWIFSLTVLTWAWRHRAALLSQGPRP